MADDSAALRLDTPRGSHILIVKTQIESQMRSKFRLKVSRKKRGFFQVAINGNVLWEGKGKRPALTWLLVWLRTQRPFVIEIKRRG